MSAMVNEGMLLALLTSLAVYGLAVRDLRGGPPSARRRRRGGTRVGPGAAHQAERRAPDPRGRRDARDRWLARAPSPARRRPQRRARARRARRRRLVPRRACSWRPARSSRSRSGPTPGCSSSRPASARWPISCACRSRPSAIRSCSNADLLHSVWGSTFVTVWFDGHRFFLPRHSAAVSQLGHADARAGAVADGGIRAGARARRPASAAGRRRRGSPAAAPHRGRPSRATRGSPGAIPSSRW